MDSAESAPSVGAGVDQIVYSAFEVHALAGLAVWTGLFCMLAPAMIGRLTDPANAEAYLVFGAGWLAAIVAAMLGNYPTQLVDYGASAIIGYALSLIGLPAQAAKVTQAVMDEERAQAGAGEGMFGHSQDR